ncbi:MAG: hypothetical protein QM504_06625 [Pseudomonadota bacterium]
MSYNMITHDEFVAAFLKGARVSDVSFNDVSESDVQGGVHFPVSVAAMSVMNQGHGNGVVFRFSGENMLFIKKDNSYFLVSLTQHSVLKNVLGFIDESKLTTIKVNIQLALDCYRHIIESAKERYVDLSGVNCPETIRAIAKSAHADLLDVFKSVVTHTLDYAYDFQNNYDFRALRIASLYHSDLPALWDYDQFVKHYDVDKLMNQWVSNFNAVEVNNISHNKMARCLAYKFRSCTKLNAGYRFSENWRCIDGFNSESECMGKVYRYELDFLNALVWAFLYAGNYQAKSIVESIMDGEYKPGPTVKFKGFALRVYKEHYSLTIGHDEMKDVLLYVNKFAADLFKKSVHYNSAIAA